MLIAIPLIDPLTTKCLTQYDFFFSLFDTRLTTGIPQL